MYRRESWAGSQAPSVPTTAGGSGSESRLWMRGGARAPGRRHVHGIDDHHTRTGSVMNGRSDWDGESSPLLNPPAWLGGRARPPEEGPGAERAGKMTASGSACDSDTVAPSASLNDGDPDCDEGDCGVAWTPGPHRRNKTSSLLQGASWRVVGVVVACSLSGSRP